MTPTGELVASFKAPTVGHLTSSSLQAQIQRMCIELVIEYFAFLEPQPMQQKDLIQGQWIPPQYAWAKLNSDGSHAFREVNSVADYLARMARDDLQSQQVVVYFITLPVGVSDRIILGQMGSINTPTVFTNRDFSVNPD
ncbi:hypothetical protein CRG98_046956 [Punica granatum]|uniref:Uncharacterized protein n=1 Tax=Punica granatum TaxID=22663 RepID=A0A2I0HMY4_PUNGR|nr:hypothetical protein CRG98_046956 [Punica granatum]